MSAAPSTIPASSNAQRRRVSRYPLSVSIDLTVLRSGIPDCIPGRSVDLGEGGLAAITAGELRPGQIVGAEFRLPNLGAPLRAKAVVRHQAQLRCGIEFLGLSPEQKSMLRYWVYQAADQQRRISRSNHDAPSSTAAPELTNEPPQIKSRKFPRRLLWGAIAALLFLASVGWWHWYQAWTELESGLRQQASFSPATKVPASIMERLVTHRVDPAYPESVWQSHQPGAIMLDAVIGTDGSVIQARPLSGPSPLASAAVEAVRWWRFQPYRMDGRPVEVETTLTVNFP